MPKMKLVELNTEKYERLYELKYPIEVIIRVGMFIPLWVMNPRDPDDFKFKPKDLLAAIRVNRIFHKTLTPLLWTVYNEAALEPRGYKDPHVNDFMVSGAHPRGLSIRTLNKNCHLIHYLELVQGEAPAYMYKQPTMLQFKNCTNLKELKLSMFVDPVWIWQLIRANPNLSLLEWAYPVQYIYERCRCYNMSRDLRGSCDLEYMRSLRKLKTLRLVGWELRPIYLCQVLNNTSETLEELELIGDSYLTDYPPDGDIWMIIKGTEPPRTLEEEEYAIAMRDDDPKIPLRPLLCPKLKRLCLNLAWEHTTCRAVYSMFRAFPALEQLQLVPEQRLDMVSLSWSLREYCPHLESIEGIARLYTYKNTLPASQQRMAALIGACPPGRLVSFNMGLMRMDEFTTAALCAHEDSLAELELIIRGTDLKNENMIFFCSILSRCKKLKLLTINMDDRKYDRTHGNLLMTMPWACKDLERLTVRGIQATEIVHQPGQAPFASSSSAPSASSSSSSSATPSAKKGKKGKQQNKAKGAEGTMDPNFMYSTACLPRLGWFHLPEFSLATWPADPVFRLALIFFVRDMSKLKFLELNGDTYYKPELPPFWDRIQQLYMNMNM
ncbi:hypothetical protein BGX23_001129 [Mortierella sp. AD031]|nr:hypothetical protein BGX23_001129 [Mortierella sp. AD031]KAG0206363.1 hypothetical protein BGX33_007448 [Mortierella sp. NVP41]